MFYYLSQLPAWLAGKGYDQWADWLSPMNVFQYSSFRSAGAAVTALQHSEKRNTGRRSSARANQPIGHNLFRPAKQVIDLNNKTSLLSRL
jgi:hypothetical protein